MKVTYLLPSFLFMLILASCSGDEIASNKPTPTNPTEHKDSIKDEEQITFTSEEPTRTSITHLLGQGAKVFWSTGDWIWVKTSDGVLRQSSAGTLNIDKTRGVFTMPSTDKYNNGALVTYTGQNSSVGNQVTIASSQTQSDCNNFDHAGLSGDCGIGKAIGSGKSFQFTLDHKASYICLLPRSSNGYVNRSRLFKIEIISENDIAGTYNLAENGKLTLANGGTNRIVLTLGTEFQLNNSSTDIGKNGSYVVIAPGQHSLAIRYWLRNTTDQSSGSSIEGTITKYVNMNFQPGKIHDITSNLAPTDYSSQKFYMWDAQQDYWQGGNQSSLVGATGSGWPTGPGPRWYNTGTSAASNSAKSCPNVNQMLWYAHSGDWHTDRDELWTWRGHLWKGGTWVLKRANFSMNANKAPDGQDYRSVSIQDVYGRAYINYTITKFTRPVGSQLNRYFFLPYFGIYFNGEYRKNADAYGYYVTSTPYPGNLGACYYIDFYDNGLFVAQGDRWVGGCAIPFP